MIVLDTDIATLLSYGKTDKLNKRIAALDKGEKLGLTIITQMEMLDGRFASIKKAIHGKVNARCAVLADGKSSF